MNWQPYFHGENLKMDMEKLPPSFPSKKVSVAATLSMMESSIVEPLLFYKIIVETVRNW